MIPRSSTLVLTLFLASEALFLPTQSQEQSPVQTLPGQSTYSFHTDTRVVLTDVTVTDADGNPVHGLGQSAFHIFDNKKLQVIASFEEHSSADAATIQPASTDGIYSNDYLLHQPAALNILLIDIANMDMAEQMYLNYELTKFLSERPDGEPLAIYLRAGSGCFLVQSFTSNRKLLLQAVNKAIPRFPPLEREYLSDIDTLDQMVISLRSLPGRKNVLWFSGGSTAFLIPDAIPLQNDEVWRDLYDDLDQGRIAIYPIDARGLISEPDTITMDRAQQHRAMNDVAQATGGHAFYDDNAFKAITEHLLGSDGSFYTLTYSPRHLHFDNKWHKVHVEVDGAAYQLSYRSGYFADGSIRGKTQPPARTRMRLLQSGEKLEESELRDRPIVFGAALLPASDPAVANLDLSAVPFPPHKHGSVPFLIRYTVPLDALTMTTVDGIHQTVLGVVASALNSEGIMVEQRAEEMTVILPEDVLRRPPGLHFTVSQRINLSPEDMFLHLGVWDPVSGRFGSIQTPLEVPKPGKSHVASGQR